MPSTPPPVSPTLVDNDTAIATAVQEEERGPYDDIDEVIDYNRKPTPENDDDDPRLPFFPNHPHSSHYYPLMIPRSDNDQTCVVAPYIFYHNNNQHVVGCMGRDQPPYAEPIYLRPADPPIHIPIPIPDAHEVVQDLGDPCIKAEVSHLCNALCKQTTLQKQREDIEKQLTQLQHAQFNTDLEINGIWKRMEKADVDTIARWVMHNTRNSMKEAQTYLNKFEKKWGDFSPFAYTISRLPNSTHFVMKKEVEEFVNKNKSAGEKAKEVQEATTFMNNLADSLYENNQISRRINPMEAEFIVVVNDLVKEFGQADPQDSLVGAVRPLAAGLIKDYINQPAAVAVAAAFSTNPRYANA
ncbi:hypothetical protein BJY52DRAFT_1199823 [Lactarius psammicola]|nr:hypothetical protein BJY52DRAFT_1199823 [Lactarius psammicola]